MVFTVRSSITPFTDEDSKAKVTDTQTETGLPPWPEGLRTKVTTPRSTSGTKVVVCGAAQSGDLLFQNH